MIKYLIPLLFLASSVYACDKAPNGTDKALNWWQCNSGPMMFYNMTSYDSKGNYEYPIHLGAPITMKTDAMFPKSYSSPGLRQTINLWSWGGWNGCSWSSLPTLGLLKDLDACSNGVPCPIKAGRQYIDIILDFTKFQQIVDLLTDNAPYQLEYMLHDKVSGDDGCVLAQAWARIP